ncbi:MAG: GDP-mannose 4,6-dehydratase [Candidatus Krumholzibacteriota bacterium]|nr:GDP-mannose 4,6-dehydratase [Candidatus Krumholzibacteriota bacterium]
MRAMVTGANGFVGRYLLGELSEAGYDLLAVDLSSSADVDPCEFPPDTVYRRCDLRDAVHLNELLEEWEPGNIFHLAARSSAARSFHDPAGTFQANLIGTLNLLEAERRIGLGAKMMLTGSSEEYGVRTPGEMPLSEESPIEPVSPYAASKAAQNLLAMQYFRTFGSNLTMTRSFGHTGPGQTDTFVLPSFARQCALISAGEKDPVISAGNLDVERDFLDVRDVVRAYRLLMEKGRAGQVYNVCSGSGLVLKDALERIASAAGVEVEIRTDPDLLRPVDIPVMIGNNQKLREDTGWIPEISADRMLDDLVLWWKEKVSG